MTEPALVPPCRPIDLPSLDEALRLLRPHLERLRSCFDAAWRAWEAFGAVHPEGRRPLGSLARATFVRDHVIHTARTVFADVPGVAVRKRERLITLDVHGKLSVRFKKLTPTLKPRNLPTHAQTRIGQQLYLPGIEPAAAWVIAGYVLDASQTEIAGVALTCPRDGQNTWAVELEPAGSYRKLRRGERITARRSHGAA